MKRNITLIAAIACVTGSVLTSGCVAFRQSTHNVDLNTRKAKDAKYDVTDFRSMTTEMGEKIASVPVIASAKTPPIVVILGIENRTTEHLDTKALANSMRGKLLHSGKMQFVNASRRDKLLQEQSYHLKHVTADSRVAVGKQLGAKYMLTGTMIQMKSTSGRAVRVSKKEERFYQLMVEVTDLETSLVVAQEEVERAKEVSKPLIGW
jgi:hypothetical protein